MRRTDLTPAQAIKRIAEIATDVAWHAGVSSSELAGQFVSILTTHPELTDKFLVDGICAFEDGDWTKPELGCLSWCATNGTIVTPEEMRKRKKQPRG